MKKKINNLLLHRYYNFAYNSKFEKSVMIANDTILQNIRQCLNYITSNRKTVKYEHDPYLIKIGTCCWHSRGHLSNNVCVNAVMTIL